MAKLTNELSCSQITEMLYLELKKQGIDMIEDEEANYNNLYSAAESILYEGSCTDISEVVDRIKKYISDTKTNYPTFFSTGDC